MGKCKKHDPARGAGVVFATVGMQNLCVSPCLPAGRRQGKGENFAIMHCKRRDNPAGVGAAFASSVGSGLLRRLWLLAMTIRFPVFISVSKSFSFSVLKIFYRFFVDLCWNQVRISRYKGNRNSASRRYSCSGTRISLASEGSGLPHPSPGNV